MAAAIPIGDLRFMAAPVELAGAGAGAERDPLKAEFDPVVAALVRVPLALAVVVVAALGVVAASVLDSAPLNLLLVGSLSIGGVMVTPAAEQAAT